MFNTLMIDIETTGTKPGCKVLSIGACGYNEEGVIVEFYEKISAAKSLEIGLTDDQSTMDWWNRQDEETRNEAFSGTKSPIEVIAEFMTFFYKNFNPGRKGSNSFTVWCCGMDFDFPIMEELFNINGRNIPWLPFVKRDYRTIKNEFPSVKMNEQNGEKHNALEDARGQMRGLVYFRNLKKSWMDQ